MTPEQQQARIEAALAAFAHGSVSSDMQTAMRECMTAALDAADRAVPVTVVDAITPRNPGESRGDRCPTCGSPVLVVAADEGTHHYEPAGMMLLERAERAEAAARDFAETLGDIGWNRGVGRQSYDQRTEMALDALDAHPGWAHPERTELPMSGE